MKVGLFTDAYLPEISGVTTVVHWLREELDRLGHESYVYAPRYDLPMEEEPRTYRFRAGPVFSYKTARAAVPYSREASRSFENLDIVHSHTPFSLAYVAMMASFRQRIPHVQTYHTYLSHYRHYVPRPLRPPVKAAEKYSALLCNRCTTVTVPTRSIQRELERFGVRRPMHVLPFGPDLRQYGRPPVWDPRAVLSVPDDAPLYMYAGRLAEEKNLLFLLRAFDRIHREDPRAILVFAGDGPLRAELEALSRQRSIVPAVRFAGFLDSGRLIDLYKSADLFLFSSKSETQGLVLVEAMAGGTPAVAVDAFGVNDVVQDGVNGFLASEDEEAFAQAVMRARGDRTLYETLRAGAFATAEATSAERFVKRMIEIYEEVLRTPRSRRRRLPLHLRRQPRRGA